MGERRGDWCCTFTGGRSWPEDPRPEDIHPHDIAHALSLLCRFGGHTREFYSVAQHSVLVSYACHPNDALWGLLHDASEAYLVDVPRPAKLSDYLEGYRVLEARMMEAVCDAVGLPHRMPESVREADDVLLATEARDLMAAETLKLWRLEAQPLTAVRIQPWPPARAKERFLQRLKVLLVRGSEAGQHCTWGSLL